MIATLKAALVRNLDELSALGTEERLALRYERLRGLGNGLEPLPEPGGEPAVPAPAVPQS
jgi:hypothetical protein